MIVALLNQKGGVGKTTLALHLAGECTSREQRVMLIGADPQDFSRDRSEARAREVLPRRFAVIGLTRDTPHRKAPKLAHGGRADATAYTARLTIDVTPELRGQTDADMLRRLLTYAFPAEGDAQ
jgi:cellulose biosynthesis protein BcsQ